MKTPSIDELASAVIDNGRRGNPARGCDCVQCFGYCLFDRNMAVRESFQVRAKDDAE